MTIYIQTQNGAPPAPWRNPETCEWFSPCGKRALWERQQGGVNEGRWGITRAYTQALCGMHANYLIGCTLPYRHAHPRWHWIRKPVRDP